MGPLGQYLFLSITSKHLPINKEMLLEVRKRINLQLLIIVGMPIIWHRILALLKAMACFIKFEVLWIYLELGS